MAEMGQDSERSREEQTESFSSSRESEGAVGLRVHPKHLGWHELRDKAREGGSCAEAEMQRRISWGSYPLEKNEGGKGIRGMCFSAIRYESREKAREREIGRKTERWIDVLAQYITSTQPECARAPLSPAGQRRPGAAFTLVLLRERRRCRPSSPHAPHTEPADWTRGGVQGARATSLQVTTSRTRGHLLKAHTLILNFVWNLF